MELSKSEINRKINQYTFCDQLCLGNFVFDEEKRVLTLNEQSYFLRSKVFQILCFLIYAKGRLVHRDVLVSSIWPNNEAVGQKSLTHGICMLRRVFSLDRDKSANILTVSKTGYRLILDTGNESSEHPTQANIRVA